MTLSVFFIPKEELNRVVKSLTTFELFLTLDFTDGKFCHP
jgi:hypothetical protein